jgi:hypothetical protein
MELWSVRSMIMADDQAMKVGGEEPNGRSGTGSRIFSRRPVFEFRRASCSSRHRLAPSSFSSLILAIFSESYCMLWRELVCETSRSKEFLLEREQFSLDTPDPEVRTTSYQLANDGRRHVSHCCAPV